MHAGIFRGCIPSFQIAPTGAPRGTSLTLDTLRADTSRGYIPNSETIRMGASRNTSLTLKLFLQVLPEAHHSPKNYPYKCFQRYTPNTETTHVDASSAYIPNFATISASSFSGYIPNFETIHVDASRVYIADLLLISCRIFQRESMVWCGMRGVTLSCCDYEEECEIGKANC